MNDNRALNLARMCFHKNEMKICKENISKIYFVAKPIHDCNIIIRVKRRDSKHLKNKIFKMTRPNQAFTFLTIDLN